MRIVARLIIGVAVVLLLTAVALFLLRKPIAEAAVEQVMARARLEAPDAVVVDVDLSRLTLATLRAGRGEPDLSLSNVVFDYRFLDLILRGKFVSIAIENGGIAVAIDRTGAVSIAGWSPDRQAKPAPPPFKTLKIDGLSIVARTPKGEAAVSLAGEFDIVKGGALALDLATDEAGFDGAIARNAAGAFDTQLAPDGAIRMKGVLKGDVATPMGVARGLSADLSGALSSWKGYVGDGPRALDGAIEARLASSQIATADAPGLAPLAGVAGIETLTVDGVLRAGFDSEGIRVSFGDDALNIASSRGDRLVLKGRDGAVFERGPDGRRVSLVASLDGPNAAGENSIEATSVDGKAWRFEGAAALKTLAVAGASLEGLNGAYEGEAAGGRVSGAGDFSALLRGAKIGRLRIHDAPAAARLDFSFDSAAKRLSATPATGECAKVERAALRMDGQDMEARIGAAEFCADAAPLVVIDWRERPLTRVAGALDAKSAYYRLGRTVFDGVPPHMDFALDYDPGAQTSDIVGDLSGGRVTLNKALLLTNADGRFETRFVGERMTARATLSSMRIAQNAELETVAPVSVEGEASLADNISRFDFKVATPKGVALGRGEGVHNVATGVGEALFDSGRLGFGYALQPDRVIPALKGVVSGASGATEGRAAFSWTPAALASSATISLDKVSFQGPGVAVTRTEGVSGKLVLSNLSPVTTAGEQTLSIAKVDMDALKLENGTIRFALPGDDTLKIIEAEFPWFDGTIGAYDSQMSISGRSETTLQIDNVDLAAALNYLNVDGLSGVGTIEGVLPLSIEGGRARINAGVVSSKGPGVIRYQGKATAAVAQSNEQSALAFEALRELRFEKLAATIDGPLDGTINFNILFDGRSDIPVRTGKKTQRVDSPVKYRVTINAPLLSLIEQAITSTDVRRQIDRAKENEATPDSRN